MKSYESRINALEQKLIPNIERLVIMYAVDEEREYFANGTRFLRPDGISHEAFIEELESKFSFSGPTVIFATVKPDIN